MTDVIAITLTVAQWELLVRSAEASEPVYRKLGDVNSADLSRTAVRAVKSRLA